MNEDDQQTAPKCLGCSAMEIEQNCVEFMGRKYCRACPVVKGDDDGAD